MKVQTVTYEKLKSDMSYSHRKIGVQIALADGDDPEKAILAAKAFVHYQLGEIPTGAQLEAAKEIIAQAEGASEMIKSLTAPKD